MIIIIKRGLQARLGESDRHPISPITPAQQNQLTERNKRENIRRRKGSKPLRITEKTFETRQSHTLEYRVTKIGSWDTDREIKIPWFCKSLDRGGTYVYR